MHGDYAARDARLKQHGLPLDLLALKRVSDSRKYHKPRFLLEVLENLMARVHTGSEVVAALEEVQEACGMCWGLSTLKELQIGHVPGDRSGNRDKILNLAAEFN